MKMQRVLKLVCAILCVVLIAALAPTQSQAKTGSVITVGFIGVLSGPNALNGTLGSRGATLAVDEINKAGGISYKGVKHKINLVTEDDAGLPPNAVNAANLLIQQEHAFAILGPDFSNNVLGTLPITKANKVLQFYSTTSAATTSGDNNSPYAFRSRSADVYWADLVVKYIIAKVGKSAKVGTAAMNIEYGLTGIASVAGDLAHHGLVTVASTTHNFGAIDLSASAATLVKANANVVVAWTLQAQGVLLLRALRQLGWNGTFIYSTPDPIFIDVGQSDVNGVVGPQNWAAADKSARSKKFVKAYRAKYGDLPDGHAVAYYDAVYFMKYGIEKQGLNVPKVAKFLRNLKTWEAVQGTFTPGAFKNGNVTKVTVLVQIQNGQIKIINIK
jgi:branched-chain amino acid transport system substrate-binding protein